MTPLTSLKFGELVVKAGFPEGVVNIVSGSGGYVVIMVVMWLLKMVMMLFKSLFKNYRIENVR